MAFEIVYQPQGLSFDEFHRVDRDCFPQEPVRAETFSEHVRQDFFAVYDSGTLVGYCYITRKPDMAWLSRIGVARAHRKRGIGTRLMECAVEHCEHIGLPRILLYVRTDNSDAIRLYRRFGFRKSASAYQFVVHRPQHSLSPVAGSITAVPITELPRSAWPAFPPEWTDLAKSHLPPKRYVLVFRDQASRTAGYCRLDPGFPGCFPFVVEDPAANLSAVLATLRPYLLPDKDSLILSFSSDELAAACADLGFHLNYRLSQMIRDPKTSGSPTSSP